MVRGKSGHMDTVLIRVRIFDVIPRATGSNKSRGQTGSDTHFQAITRAVVGEGRNWTGC